MMADFSGGFSVSHLTHLKIVKPLMAQTQNWFVVIDNGISSPSGLMFCRTTAVTAFCGGINCGVGYGR